jgi:uracil-DNA glycosylase
MKYDYNNIVTSKIKNGWLKIIKSERNDLNKIIEEVNNSNNKHQIYPIPKKVFKAFNYFEPHETKLVLLGQDPYIRYEMIDNKKVPQAMGLSFSIPKKMKKIPPSLVNIYKEIHNSYNDFNIPNHGCLIKWVKTEKVLLLNSALTVIEGNSGSHLKYWEVFTDKIIKYISDTSKNIIFLLLGNFAKQKSYLIDSNKHKIITSVHPSPLSAYRGFFGSNIFKQANDYLKNNKIKEINWNIKSK